LDAEVFRIFPSILKYVTEDSDGVPRQKGPTFWGEGFGHTTNEKYDTDGLHRLSIFSFPVHPKSFRQTQAYF